MSLKGHNMTNEHVAGASFRLRGSAGLMVIHLLMAVYCDASGPLSRPLSINQAWLVSVVTDVACARERVSHLVQ